MALSEKERKAILERRRNALVGSDEALSGLAELFGGSVDQNQIPVLGEGGVATGEYYDRRLGAPESATPQPDPTRYLFHKQYLENKYKTRFAPTAGQTIPEFDPIDPYQSDGAMSSLGNILASAYPSSLTGGVEAGLEKFLTGEGDANLLGLIDAEKQAHWQPNKAEEILTGLASFGIDIPALVGITALTGGTGTAASIGAKAAQAAKVFGTYEGSKGFFEGYVEDDFEEGISRGLKRGAEGTVLGAAVGGVGAKAGQMAKGAFSKAVLPPTSEIVTLGTVQPFIEGRTPTSDDYLNAAGFIVGIKMAGGLAKLGKKTFQKAVAVEAAKLEEAGPENLARIEREAFIESPAFNNKLLDKIESAKEGAVVGTLGDFIVEPRVRAAYGPALDTPIRVAKGEMVEGEARVGWVDFSEGKPAINIASDFTEFAGKTILHEGAHILQSGKGRVLSEAGPEKMAEWATKAKPASDKANKAAEAAARRGWGKVVQASKGKPISYESAPTGIKTVIDRISKENKPKKVAVISVASDKPTTNPTGRILYGANNEGATIGYFEGVKKGKFKTKGTATLLDISTTDPRKATELVKTSLASAESEKVNLYLSKRVASSPVFKTLQAAGLVGKKTKSGAYRLQSPAPAPPKLPEPIPSKAEKPPETARPATPEAPKVSEATKEPVIDEGAAKTAAEAIPDVKYDRIFDFEGKRGKQYQFTLTIKDQESSFYVKDLADLPVKAEEMRTKMAEGAKWRAEQAAKKAPEAPPVSTPPIASAKGEGKMRLYRTGTIGNEQPGTFFSEHPAVATAYQTGTKNRSSVKAYDVTLSNPLVVEGGQTEAARILGVEIKPTDTYAQMDAKIKPAAQNAGYDGIIYSGGPSRPTGPFIGPKAQGIREVVAFDKNAINDAGEAPVQEWYRAKNSPERVAVIERGDKYVRVVDPINQNVRDINPDYFERNFKSESPPPVKPVVPKTVKEPWGMTSAEFMAQAEKNKGRDWSGEITKGELGAESSYAQLHLYSVREALKKGLPVPEEVLKDYPDLAAKYGGKAYRTIKVSDIKKASEQAAKVTEGLPTRVGGFIRKVLRNPIITAVKPYERRVSTPEGKEIVQMSYEYGARQARIFHSFYSPIEATLKALSDAEANSKNIASKFRQTFDEAHAAMKIFKTDLGYVPEYMTRMLKPDVAAELRDAIKNLDLSTFDPKTPKEFILRKIAEQSEVAAKQIQFWLDNGKIKTVKQGWDFLSRDLKRQFSLEPNFFKERTLEYMDGLYETDIREVLPRYLIGASRYLAAQQSFGKDLKGLNDRLYQLAKRGETDAQLVSDMVGHLTGSFEFEHGLSKSARKVADVYVGWQVGSKIGTGLATWLNVFQPLYSFMPKTGVFNAIAAGFEFLDPAARAAATKAVKESGALGLFEERLAQSLAGHRPGGAFGIFADKMTKYSGFQGINRWNLLWAGNVARRMIPVWYKQAAGQGRRAELAKGWLKDIGVEFDPKRPDFISPDQLANGIYRFATETQLQRLVMKEPSAFHHPIIKHFFLFKRYGYRQALLIGETLSTEFKRGNYMPMIRLAVAGYLGGAGVVWGMNKFKSFISGEPAYDKSDNLYEEFVQRLGAMGAMGVISDFLKIDKLSRLPDAARFTLSPVFASDVERVFDSYTKFMEDWERYGDAWLATKRNAYNIVSPVGTIPRETAKRLMPASKKRDRQKYLRTKEKEDIMVLLFNGDHEAASRRVQNWNKYYPDTPLTSSDYSTGALMQWINNRASRYAKAKTGEDAGRDFAIEERKRRLELLKEAGLRRER